MCSIVFILYTFFNIASACSQEERENILTKFKNRDFKFLIATDVLAKGIDIEKVDVSSYVYLLDTILINYDDYYLLLIFIIILIYIYINICYVCLLTIFLTVGYSIRCSSFN